MGLRWNALPLTRFHVVQEFPLRLHHNTPGWVRSGSVFHIRIRVSPTQNIPLTKPTLAADLLKSVQLYHDSQKWWCKLFLLMPDHLHALLAFPRESGMSATIREWKRGAARIQGVQWQDNYFDHRVRSAKLEGEVWNYIRRNPAVKGLCPNDDLWAYWWSGVQQRIEGNALHLDP